MGPDRCEVSVERWVLPGPTSHDPVETGPTVKPETATDRGPTARVVDLGDSKPKSDPLTFPAYPHFRGTVPRPPEGPVHDARRGCLFGGLPRSKDPDRVWYGQGHSFCNDVRVTVSK